MQYQLFKHCRHLKLKYAPSIANLYKEIYALKRHSETCNESNNMENKVVVSDNLPSCFNQKDCNCFETCFTTPINYNPNDVLQYTSFNLREIVKYINIVESHRNLDRQINSDLHSTVFASEVNRATDHFLETVRRFQLQLLIYQDKGEFFCTHYSEVMSVNKLNKFYEELGHINQKSIQLFNSPKSPMPTKFLADILEMHKNCLYMFEQFYTMVHFDRPIFKKDYYNINIHGFHFRFPKNK